MGCLGFDSCLRFEPKSALPHSSAASAIGLTEPSSKNPLFLGIVSHVVMILQSSTESSTICFTVLQKGSSEAPTIVEFFQYVTEADEKYELLPLERKLDAIIRIDLRGKDRARQS